MTIKQVIRKLPQYSAKEFVRRREKFLDLGYSSDDSTRLSYYSFVFPNIDYRNLYDHLKTVEDELS